MRTTIRNQACNTNSVDIVPYLPNEVLGLGRVVAEVDSGLHSRCGLINSSVPSTIGIQQKMARWVARVKARAPTCLSATLGKFVWKCPTGEAWRRRSLCNPLAALFRKA